MCPINPPDQSELYFINESRNEKSIFSHATNKSAKILRYAALFLKNGPLLGLLMFCWAQSARSSVTLFNGGTALNGPNLGFVASKLKMPSIYFGVTESFYCSCALSLPYVDVSNCAVKQNIGFYKAVETVQYEHVVPASLVKKKLEVLRFIGPYQHNCLKKSRKCSLKASQIFRAFEGDMHNIRPIVAKLNTLRGSKDMGFIGGRRAQKGCGFRYTEKLFEPPDKRKGDVARIYLYMNDKYRELSILSKIDRKIMLEWSRRDPADRLERLINERIFKQQGDENYYVERFKR